MQENNEIESNLDQENDEIESNLDTNEESIKTIESKLSESFCKQKYFIQLIKDNIKLYMSNNKEPIIKLEKMSCILPHLIKTLGLPFCDLITNNNEIIEYYVGKFISDKNKENKDISKTILINYINIYNFKSTDSNPSDKLIELLKNTDIDIKNMQDNKRLTKSIIESIYDEIADFFNTLKAIRNMEEDIEEEGFDQIQLLFKEKINKINDIEKIDVCPKATIEFLREKMNEIENFINKKKINKSNQNIINNVNPQNSDNNIVNKINIQLNLDNSNSGLNEDESKKLREIELKNRTSFYKNEYLVYGEDDLTEFKNYLYPFNEGQEKEIKRQYIGFLNSNGGRIYIGINDQRVVRGVVLTYKNCDIFRNTLVGFMNDFYPKCRLDKIKVYFIPIKNPFTKKYINDLYVVKIIILPGDPYILYSITKRGGFISAIRRQSQVFNLDAEEITKEIIARNELKKNSKNQIQIPNFNIGFNDPEPEINLEISHTFEEKEKYEDSDNLNYYYMKSKILIDKKYVYIVNVKNIDTNLKVKEINKFFNGCQQSYQKFFSKEGKSLGYGRIHFTNEDAANAVIKKYNGKNLGGKKNICMTLKKSKFFNKINN